MCVRTQPHRGALLLPSLCRDIVEIRGAATSQISGTDVATAYVDEVERAKHPRQRFTVGHENPD